MTRLQPLLVRLAPILFLVGIALVVAACVPGTNTGGAPGASGSPSQAPLQPASPGANPIDLLAWLFTPIFQALFIVLVFFDRLTRFFSPEGNIVIAIILLTVVIRVLVIPLYRRQLVSTRQMQLVQPEVKEIQRKYKGDRIKQQAAVQEYYRQRGMNPAGGCLPILLQFGLLIPMYSVISQGLTNYDPSAMWHIFGINLFPGIGCPAAPDFDAAGHVINACLNPVVAGQFPWGLPEPYTTGLYIFGFGISILAIISSLVQVVASRMTLPAGDPKNDDPNIKVQRQMAYFLPLISILYGGALPAGLFIYWITATVIQIFQQYLILGWGGMFPLFGWHPGFARNHQPRFPVKLPELQPATPGQPSAVSAKPVDRDLSSQSTIRPNRTRSGRRGRRR
ncbi:MAG TPA: YidC/Oxa1 family membrane protein insertase [Candidatus Limnocylindrales bacterium]|nr:YidC/Oxa1 family membrane protein insertase [Candidatus Limnocylindrales bacterium]